VHKADFVSELHLTPGALPALPAILTFISVSASITQSPATSVLDPIAHSPIRNFARSRSSAADCAKMVPQQESDKFDCMVFPIMPENFRRQLRAPARKSTGKITLALRRKIEVARASPASIGPETTHTAIVGDANPHTSMIQAIGPTPDDVYKTAGRSGLPRGAASQTS